MNFYKDNVIKLEYNPVLESTVSRLNAVGATDSLTLRSLDFTPSDSNTLYVKKTGSDTTGDGTAANPYLTIQKAASMVTATKQNIVILDSGEYVEESYAFGTNCKSINAALGQKPVVKPDLVSSDSNYIFETIKSETTLTASAGDYDRRVKCAALSNGYFVILYENDGSTVADYRSLFQIVNSSGEIIKTETVVGIGKGYVCALDNYFIVTFRNLSNNTLGIQIYDNSGNLIYSESSISCDSDCYDVGKFGGANNRFVATYYHSGSMRFVVKNIDGSDYISSSILSSYRNSEIGQIIPRNVGNGGFIWCYRVSSSESNRWGVVDGTGSILYEGEVLSGTSYCSVCENYNDSSKITFVCGVASGGALYLIEFDLSTYSISKSSSLITTLSSSRFPDIELTNDGKFIVSVGYDSSNILVLTSNWGIIKNESFSNTVFFSGSYNYYTERYLVAWTYKTSPYSVKFLIKGGFVTDWWSFSSDVTFNGIIFDNEESYIRRYIYSSSGVFKIKWCDFQNIARTGYNDSDTYPLYVATVSGSDIDILNCRAFNNDGGFKLTGNSVLVQYCQFFKQLLNPAVYIIGAGTGVIVNHCDFLYNYTAVKLEDNAGTEIIKNSILFQSLAYSIDAETAITYAHCVNNIPGHNASAGTLVIMSNPHYVNDGYVTLADLDLMLKSRELGYTFESPAIGIGDDLKNAGSEDVEIAGVLQTWTAITVQKDLENGVQLYEDPVGAVETELGDGSVDTYRNAYTEVLKLAWRVCILADFNNLKALYHCGKNTVRVYLDPVSEPSVYGTYTVVYDKLNKFTKHPKLSRTGVEDVSITFKRAYNEGA